MLKKLCFGLALAAIAVSCLSAATLRPTLMFDGVQYTLYEGKAYVFDQNLRSLDVEVTIPESITSDGEEYTVAGFFTQDNYGSIYPSTRSPYLPRTLNLPATCSEYITEDIDGPSEIRYNKRGLDTFIYTQGEGLQYLNIAPGGDYSSYDGALYSGNGSFMLGVPLARSGKLTISPECTYVMPYRVSTGFGSDFSDGKTYAVTELEMSNYVCHISKGAFSRYTQLTTVRTYTPEKAPEPVRIEGYQPTLGIERFAFDGCSKMSSLSIPDSIRSIDAYAFNYCLKLDTVHLPKNLQSVEPYAFTDCRSLSAFEIAENAPYLACYDGSLYTAGLETLIAVPYTIKSYTSPSATRHIAEGVFSQHVNISTLKFSEGLETIGNNAFEYCNLISEILLPATMRTIGPQAFRVEANNSQYRTIRLGDALKEIGFRAFEYNKILSIDFGKSLETIGQAAFSWARWSEGIAIDFPPTLRKIADHAFDGFTVSIPQLYFVNLEYLSEKALTSFLPEKIYCARWTPPTCEDSPFNKNVYTQTELIVPEGAEKSYLTANVWWNFDKVVGHEYSGVSAPGAEADVKVTADGGVLSVTVPDGTAVEVYATDGRRIHAAKGSCTLSPAAGVYIVRAGGQSLKVRL